MEGKQRETKESRKQGKKNKHNTLFLISGCQTMQHYVQPSGPIYVLDHHHHHVTILASAIILFVTALSGAPENGVCWEISIAALLLAPLMASCYCRTRTVQKSKMNLHRLMNYRSCPFSASFFTVGRIASVFGCNG